VDFKLRRYQVTAFLDPASMLDYTVCFALVREACLSHSSPYFGFNRSASPLKAGLARRDISLSYLSQNGFARSCPIAGLEK
jgi:hypothetical protein